MGAHRREPIEPRYGRIALALSATLVTGVAAVGGLGMWSSRADDAVVAIDESGLVAERVSPDPASDGPDESDESDESDEDAGSSASSAAQSSGDQPSGDQSSAAQPSGGRSSSSQSPSGTSDDASAPPTTPRGSGTPTPDESAEPATSATPEPDPDLVLPAASGSGRRVVFSQARQRVWLVDEVSPRDGGRSVERVQRTYPVSGSVYDNLDPGTFEVYSRSADAWGIEDSGTMQWFVRFTKGTEGAAIGFHNIPVDDGAKVQTIAQLGTPLSHGCVRARTSDAKALWRFAPLGTTVVVTA